MGTKGCGDFSGASFSTRITYIKVSYNASSSLDKPASDIATEELGVFSCCM